MKKAPQNGAFGHIGAEEGIRTPTGFPPPAPQAGASAVPPLPRGVRLKPDTAYEVLMIYFGGAGVAGAAGVPGAAGVDDTGAEGTDGTPAGRGGAAVPLTTDPGPR